MENELESLRQNAHEQAMIAQHARKCLREERERAKVRSYVSLCVDNCVTAMEEVIIPIGDSQTEAHEGSWV